jgi:general secretion pathway protein E
VGVVTQVVSHAYAQRHRILPVAAAPGEVTFATAEPFDMSWAKDLAQMLRRDVHRVVASPIDINRYLAEFYGVQRSIRLATDAKGSDSSSTLLNFEQLLELGKAGEVGADDRHVVHIVDWLLQYAFEQRASDIHLEPRRDAGLMRFRIDGVMHKVFELPPAVMTAVTSRIKILSRMDVAEKRRPQDGRIKTRATTGREVELRISSMPTAFGEKLVMRIFDPEIVAKDFSLLGFSPSEEALWRSLVERPHGIVLVTGPTGSGKTTTLYSTLKHLATPDINVCTVEDPIEMVSPEFNQMQVQPSIDLDFAAGVRTLLRQDPDIIMVGEIRDLETAEIAIKAAQTGHLVLSTLHTNDAPQTLTRLVDMGVKPYAIATSVSLIIAQRLARKLCRNCKQAMDIPAEALKKEGFEQADIDAGVRVYRAVGCTQCTDGYKGRVGIYQVMPVTETIGRIIMEGGGAIQIGDQAAKDGIWNLRRAGLEKVRNGITSLEEVNNVTVE